MSYAVWNKAADYLVNDVVVYEKTLYKAVQPNRNSPPPGDAWVVVSSGLEGSNEVVAALRSLQEVVASYLK